MFGRTYFGRTTFGGVKAQISGTVAVAVGVSTLDAAGAETFTGTATESFAVAAFDASGVETFTGTAAEAVAGPALDAIGAESFSSSADIAIAGPALEAGGLTGFDASAAVAITGPALDASGDLAFDGAAALLLAGAELEADGLVAQDIDGDVAVSLAGPALAAIGTGGTIDESSFSGGPLFPPLPIRRRPEAVEGYATIGLHGPALDARGHAQAQISGAAALAVDVPGAVAGGAQTIQGPGEAAVGGTSLEALGQVYRVVRVTVLAPARALDGTGTARASRPSLSGQGSVVPAARPDGIDRAWTELQRDRPDEADALVLLGVFDA